MNIKKICLSVLAGSFTILAAAAAVFGGSALNDITDSVKNTAKAAYHNVSVQTKVIITSVQQYIAGEEPAAVVNNGQADAYIVPSQPNYVKLPNYQGQQTSKFICANSGVLVNSNLASLEEILRFSEYRGSG